MTNPTEAALGVFSSPEPWSDEDLARVGHLKEASDRILAEIRKIVVGMDSVVRLTMIGLFGQGHCLLMGVPGLGKTLLVRTLAASLSLKFRRVQFTPDLMPSDITGTDIIEEDMTTGKRTFKPNIQRVRAVVDGEVRRVSICAACIRSGRIRKPA